MKALLICEFREGKLLDSSYELVAFADKLQADKTLLLIGSEDEAPRVNSTVYIADSTQYGEYNPDLHKKIILAVVEREKPDYIVFLHSSYGWDLAPRVAVALKAGQISEIIGLTDGGFEVGICNAKLRRTVMPKTETAVLTIQVGAFSAAEKPGGTPRLERIELTDNISTLQFVGYELDEEKDVDLTKANVIVSVGRGVGKERMWRLSSPLPRPSAENSVQAGPWWMPGGLNAVIRSEARVSRCHLNYTLPAESAVLFSTWLE